jgi:ribosomal protein S18 acetylase RimI-like enzyme
MSNIAGSNGIVIRELSYRDIPSLVDIYIESFKGMNDERVVRRWIECKYRSKPISVYYVASLEDRIVGYILWTEHGGFRSDAVIELEQVAVRREFRGKGIASKLIKDSLQRFTEEYINSRGARLKLVIVTTSKDNAAKELYKRVLNASEVCTISDLYSTDESILIAVMDRSIHKG